MHLLWRAPMRWRAGSGQRVKKSPMSGLEQIHPIEAGMLVTNLSILGLLIEMRFKVGMMWKDYLQRKKLNGKPDN